MGCDCMLFYDIFQFCRGQCVSESGRHGKQRRQKIMKFTRCTNNNKIVSYRCNWCCMWVERIRVVACVNINTCNLIHHGSEFFAFFSFRSTLKWEKINTSDTKPRKKQSETITNQMCRWRDGEKHISGVVSITKAADFWLLLRLNRLPTCTIVRQYPMQLSHIIFTDKLHAFFCGHPKITRIRDESMCSQTRLRRAAQRFGRGDSVEVRQMFGMRLCNALSL